MIQIRIVIEYASSAVIRVYLGTFMNFRGMILLRKPDMKVAKVRPMLKLMMLVIVLVTSSCLSI